MRLYIDDCDEPAPRAEDVLDELIEIPATLGQTWLAGDMNVLVDCWINQIHLSAFLAEILVMHYRPRSLLPDPAVLRRQETAILDLRSKLPSSPQVSAALTLAHIHHLEFYYRSISTLLAVALC